MVSLYLSVIGCLLRDASDPIRVFQMVLSASRRFGVLTLRYRADGLRAKSGDGWLGAGECRGVFACFGETRAVRDAPIPRRRQACL